MFSEEEISKIKDAIAEVEKKTCGEVVPVIAEASGRYDRAEDMLGVLFGLVFAGASIVTFQNDWSTGLLPMLGGFLVGLNLGVFLSTKFKSLKLPFLSDKEKTEEVQRKAKECFFTFGVGRTGGATGILIYVSMFEHKVVVLGDKEIATKLAQKDWDSVCEVITSHMKENKPVEGVIAGIHEAGKLLEAHFPVAKDDSNELPNEVHFI